MAKRIGGTVNSGSESTSASASATSKMPASLSGAALIIDYGPSSTVPTSTLRGIRAHNLISPLSSPGQVDISADVDFLGLAEAAIETSEGVEVHGPIEQGEWLERMGIKARADMLVKAAGDKQDTAEAIRKAVDRLTEKSGGGMGKLYKVMAIIPEGEGKRKPVGFGGEVS